MELKGIDVSSCQGDIDWKTVATYGMGFAILRITEAGNKIDSRFERNYKGCIENHIPVGGYKYSYASTVAEIRSEANKVVSVLNGRKLDYPVWLDLEWNNQRYLGAESIHKLADAFREIIEKAGYKFGIYCNVDWYVNVICSHLKQYDFWIARYPASDNGTLQERLRPSYGIGWQYSSKATIPGIPTKVDRNVFYKDYADSNKGGDNMTKEQAINSLIAIAQNELGYLEKKSNSQLDSKTANAGQNNYTKYWRDIKPDYQGQPWCAIFISWIMMQAFGLETAKKLLKHWPYVYCPTLGSLFTKHANPQVGDIVIFYRGGTFAHTGLVTDVKGDKFYTIEGNTSNGSTIIANGGAVCKKSYYNSNLPGTKFCRPDYSIVTNVSTKSYLSKGDKGSDVKSLQQKLNILGYKGKNGKAITENGDFGTNTNYAVRAFQKAQNLEVDGKVGKLTLAALNAAVDAFTKPQSDQRIKDAQVHLNNFTGSTLKITGIIDDTTKLAFRKAIQIGLNKDFKSGLKTNGDIGKKTKASLKKVALKKGSKGYLVTVLEIGMLMNKIDPNGVECPGSMGNGLITAVKTYQKNQNLDADGIAGYNTFIALQK